VSDFGQALYALVEALGRSAIPYRHDARRTRIGRAFNLIHFASSYKFDIFPLSSDPFQQSQFSRREMRDIVLGGVKLPVPVATAEDTLLMKVVWYRSGGEASERQWNHVRGIVAVQGQRLDRDYLRQWAEYLKVADLVDAALQSEQRSQG
jgi:hypothetical protein